MLRVQASLVKHQGAPCITITWLSGSAFTFSDGAPEWGCSHGLVVFKQGTRPSGMYALFFAAIVRKSSCKWQQLSAVMRRRSCSAARTSAGWLHQIKDCQEGHVGHVMHSRALPHVSDYFEVHFIVSRNMRQLLLWECMAPSL